MPAFGLEETGSTTNALPDTARTRRRRAQPRRRMGHPRLVPTFTRCKVGSTPAPFPPHPAGNGRPRQPVHGPQLVAPSAVPTRSRALRTGLASTTGHPQRASPGVPLEMVDAKRPALANAADPSTPAGASPPLADAGQPEPAATPWYVFNDLHATMALVGAERLRNGRAWCRRPPSTRSLDYGVRHEREMRATTAETGLPGVSRRDRVRRAACDGDVIAELPPTGRVLQHFGGSHAQREPCRSALLLVVGLAVRDGSRLALALTASERLGVRER